MTDNGMSFTFWAWNPNSGDTGGLVDNDWWTVNEDKFSILEPHLVPPVADGSSSETSSPPTEEPTGDCEATYEVTGGWPGNFQANVTIENTGSTPMNGWTATWTYAGDEHIFNSWSAQVTQTGANVTATAPSSNTTLAAGQTATFGLQGTYTGTATPPEVTCTS